MYTSYLILFFWFQDKCVNVYVLCNLYYYLQLSLGLMFFLLDIVLRLVFHMKHYFYALKI